MSEKQHISQDTYAAFQNNLLSQNQQQDFLSHISSCNFCSEQFANYMTSNIMKAPRGFKENILDQVKRPEVQLVVNSKMVSKKMQLVWYSIKVGVATVSALVLLTTTISWSNAMTSLDLTDSSAWNHELEDEEQQQHIFSFTTRLRENADNVSNRMLDFSNLLIRKEETNNDKKEK